MNLKIGTIIKNLRIQNKVTQDQLATFLGVTPQAISRWEAENGYPDIELLPSLAEFFSVTTDDLLGINRTEREKRLIEIYDEIKKQRELGTGEETLPYARQVLAEFPSDEKIQINLANNLCRAYMWNDSPDIKALKEAEKIYCTILEKTNNDTIKHHAILSLCSLYSNGLKNEFKLEQTIALLPPLKYSRESVKAWAFEGEKAIYHEQDYIEKLTDALGDALQGYIAYTLPNGSEKWDEKIAMLEWVIGLYKFIFGENLLYYHDRVASLYRFIATYRVAQKKYDETLTSLELMCDHIEALHRSKHGEHFSSLFSDRLTYLTPSEEFKDLVAHNRAWYTLNKNLTQDRYDPIRENERFKAIENRLRVIAE